MAPSRKWFTAEVIDIPTTTGDEQLITRSGVLYGWAFEETTGSAGATLDLFDGSSNNGKRIVPITLLAGQSTRDIWGRPGIWCDGGVLMHARTGSIRGSLYFQALSTDEIIELLSYAPDNG